MADDLWSRTVRTATLLICCWLLVACGSTTPRAVHSGTNDLPPTARDARAKFPSKRADDQQWSRVPLALKHRVQPRVLLASRASEATVHAAGCDSHVPAATFLGATIDEFALTATFRYVPHDSGNPDLNNKPLIEGCTAKWNHRDARWEKTNCGHYAPAGSRHAVTRSGGGMIPCTDLSVRTRDAPLLIWVEPPPRARWLVVRRSADYSMAYPVVGRRPVRLIYPQLAALTWADGHATVFPYLVIDRVGHTRQLTAIGVTAG